MIPLVVPVLLTLLCLTSSEGNALESTDQVVNRSASAGETISGVELLRSIGSEVYFTEASSLPSTKLPGVEHGETRKNSEVVAGIVRLGSGKDGGDLGNGTLESERHRDHRHHSRHYDSEGVELLNEYGEDSRTRRREESTLTPEVIKVEHGRARQSNDSSSGFHLDYPAERKVPMNMSSALVIGLRIEVPDDNVASYEQNGVSIILADYLMPIRLFGQHFTNQTIVRFVQDVRSRGSNCDDIEDATQAYRVSHIGPNGASAVLQVSLSIEQSEEFFYICVRENNTDMPWVHQGSDPWMTIKAYERFLPWWLQVIVIIGLMLSSGLFAGLILGLLALDRTDLRILANTGSEKERQYARAILPLRSKGNYLLCSLVMGNVLMNTSLTILLDDLVSGFLAVTFATAGIVVFGEIIPQAICSRHGLAIGAKTIFITRFVMLVTFPLSYVGGKILDKMLGDEIGIVYNREKLKELVKVSIEHNDLQADEVNIISGALELKKKTVEDIMTRLEDVFMLPYDGLLDFETLNEIRKQGYSRIPIYNGERSNIMSILFTKDLVFVDPDDKIPLRTFAQFCNKSSIHVYADTTLDLVFKEFKESQKGHMALVQKFVGPNIKERDPFYEYVGVVTLEDVIEELIQAEIVDETDVWTDNRSKKKTKQCHTKDFAKFVEIHNSQKALHISPQLALAAFQFLSTGIEPFKSNFISDGVLHRVLKKNVLFKIRSTKDLKPCLLYECGKPTDTFTLILEGRVEVVVGKEGLQYEAGPFGFFAIPALMLNAETNFTPDYTVKTTGDVIILRIKRALYQAAVQATALERAKTDGTGSGDNAQDLNMIEKQIEDVLGKLEPETLESNDSIANELEISATSETSIERSTTSTDD